MQCRPLAFAPRHSSEPALRPQHRQPLWHIRRECDGRDCSKFTVVALNYRFYVTFLCGQRHNSA